MMPDSAETIPDLVARLRGTFDSGRTKPRAWRRRQLEGLGRMLDERGDDLARAIDADMRRGEFEASLFDLAPTRGEVTHALTNLRRWMRPRRVPTTLWTTPGRAWVQYEPLGVVLIISPWNYPVHLALTPLVAALAAGDCAIVKPSELTPRTSAALAALLPHYLDTDAVAVVEGGAEATLGLIDQGLDHVFFTGSPAVGRRVMAAAAEHLTPVTLELGGKCPTVVTASADLRVAARRVAFGKLTNSGQTCVAPDHVLVDRRVRDEFVGLLVAALDEFSEGAASPILNSGHAERLAELAADAGGTVVRGGAESRADGEGARDGGGGGSGDGDGDGGASGDGDPRMPVTVVVDPREGARVREEEIFGPLLPVLTVDGLDGAIDAIRAGTKPLASYLFTSDRRDERRFLERVSTGGVLINHVVVHLAVPELPFGGVGTSGFGKYHGHWGFETFSNAKAVLRQSTRVDLPLLYPPYRGWKRRLIQRSL